MRFILNILFLFPFIGFGQTAAFINGGGEVCDNSNMNVDVYFQFSGISPHTFVYAINGVNQPPITSVYNVYSISTSIAGTYVLHSYNDSISPGTVSGSALVTVVQSPIAHCIANPDSVSVLSPTTTLYDLSIGNISYWMWFIFINDSLVAEEQNSIITFPQWPPAVYQVYLMVEDEMGCSDTAYTYVTVGHPTTSIQEHNTNKELLKATDILGRETKGTNQPLFYIYDDGTVEKKIIIE